jgi:hypothetical protein
MLEMGDVEVVLDSLDLAGRLQVMTQAMDYVMFRALTPLSAVMSSESAFLVESAIDLVRTWEGSQELLEDLDERIGARVNDEASVASIMLVSSIYLLGALLEAPRGADAGAVLFNCYDATVHRQGFGRTVTLEHQLSSEPCLDVIRQQKDLLDMQ